MAQRLLTLGQATPKLRLLPPGRALSFPNFIGLTTPLTAGTMHGQSFTVEMWVRVNDFVSPPGYTGGTDFQCLFLSSVVPTSVYSYALLLYPNGAVQFRNYTNGGQYNTGTAVIKIGRWQHLAFVHDYAAMTMIFYINGAAVYQNAITTAIPDVRGFCIGNVDSARNSYNLFGSVDEFRVWKYARTAEQIAADYTRPNAALIADGQITAANTAFCYDFDDLLPVTLPQILDKSGNGRTTASSFDQLSSSQIGACPMLTGYPATTARRILTLAA